jgi:hypothetical protein
VSSRCGQTVVDTTQSWTNRFMNEFLRLDFAYRLALCRPLIVPARPGEIPAGFLLRLAWRAGFAASRAIGFLGIFECAALVLPTGNALGRLCVAGRAARPFRLS